LSAGLLGVADSLGISESFCPVRAMLGAFLTEAHFPIPDLSICSVGATCDDFSAIAQRLESMGFPILWWEIPARRVPDPDEISIRLPGGFCAPEIQIAQVRTELDRVRGALEGIARSHLDDQTLAAGIHIANQARYLLSELRHTVFTARSCPLPALEMQIAEMLAIHFCSDRDECIHVLQELLGEVRRRVDVEEGVLPEDAVRVFWINPVADLRVMNLLEDCGGRLCGSDYLFCHALDPIPEDLPPMDAMARMALADPMVGPGWDRAERLCSDILRFGAECAVISRIPGASHCALESELIRNRIQCDLSIPVLEIEVPPVMDAMQFALRARLEALIETVRQKRR
ncbi:MAG: 2-hydroxyacyl-CoA dehydratase family protein, partial [bacterium]